MSNIRKGDNVVVITGSDKGKKGSVLKVFPSENRALVQGVNIVKRHQRQTSMTSPDFFATRTRRPSPSVL